MTVRRVHISANPFPEENAGKVWHERGVWPVKWIALPGDAKTPLVWAFRLPFTLAAAAVIRVHVSADERYELWLDGERVARGSERGDTRHWYYETFDLELPAGDHRLVARVWAQGEKAAYAQFTVRPGFILAAEGEWLDRLSTGRAPWEGKAVGGYEWIGTGDGWGTGENVRIDGAAYPWGVERGEGDSWGPVESHHPGNHGPERNENAELHMMEPGTLPLQLDVARRVGRVRLVAAPPTVETRTLPVRAADHLPAEAPAWQALVEGRGAVTVPARSRRRVLVDLENYYCGYPEVTVSGGRGGRVRVHWEEALYEGAEEPHRWVRQRSKGHRGEVEGKYFVGIGDEFLPDGGPARTFAPLWWESGRYLEILAEAGAEPLTLDGLTVRETRYPLEMESALTLGDPALEAMLPILVRGVQMCSHETYVDCPFYEQLMYVGDTRLEALVTYVMTHDDRLPRKAIRMFDHSRLTTGITQSRYPSRIRQVIPPFSLIWIAMVHDYARFRGDRAFVASLLPGVRTVIDFYRGALNADGLVEGLNGWNYMDWVPEWADGIPPEGDRGVSGPLNWQFVRNLQLAAELELWAGESELAHRARRLADQVATKATAVFWDEKRGLLADDIGHTRYSEHGQCLALLTRTLGATRQARIADGLVNAPDLSRTTVYFSYYLFSAYRLIGRMDKFFERLSLWSDLVRLGFKTTLESPEPTRSDCHGWGAHPLFHFFTRVLGVRPADFGFANVVVEPHLGPLASASGKMVHPKGWIEASFRKDGPGLKGTVSLPAGVGGVLYYGGRAVALREGPQDIALA